MSDENQNQNQASNKKMALVRQKIAEWHEAGGELPPVKEQKRLKKEYLQARAAVESAREEAKRIVAEAEQRVRDAALECVTHLGPTPLMIDDEIYDPASISTTIYYRKRRDNDAPEPI